MYICIYIYIFVTAVLIIRTLVYLHLYIYFFTGVDKHPLPLPLVASVYILTLIIQWCSEEALNTSRRQNGDMLLCSCNGPSDTSLPA